MRFQESQSVELKALYTPDLKKEIVAFANTNGGTIYIGVRDNGEIVGLDQPDFVMQQISNSIRDGIKPDVSMFTNIDVIQEEHKHIIKLAIYPGSRNHIISLIKDSSRQVYMSGAELVLFLHPRMPFG